MTSPALIIGNKNYSSWSLRSWLFLRKNNIDFIKKTLWLDEPAFKPAIDPIGSDDKVPVLLEADHTVWDSLAIIESSIDRYSCRYSLTAYLAMCARARPIGCEMHSSFTALRAECPTDIRNNQKIELSQAASQDVRRVEQIWRQALKKSGKQGRWLYSDFSVADAIYVPAVFCFERGDVALSPLTQSYKDYVLADKTVQKWIRDAKQETH